MTTSSSVLVVGPRSPLGQDLGAAFARHFNEAESIVREQKPKVVVFSRGKQNEFSQFCEFLKKEVPFSKWILLSEGLSPALLMDLINEGSVFNVIDSLESAELVSSIQGALVAVGEEENQSKMLELSDQQKSRLERLHAELEVRVEKRQKAVKKSSRNLEVTQSRLEAFHKILIEIHRAKSISEMELRLNEALNQTLKGVQVYIRFSHSSSLTSDTVFEIPFLDPKMKGHAIFKRDAEPFSASETQFLSEVTEALALAITRLQKLNLAETLKAEWQATFDSISHPLCLTDDKFHITKMNRAFQQSCADKSFQNLLGRNCFKALLGMDVSEPKSPTFRAQRPGMQSDEHFEVSCERLGAESEATYLVLFREVTEDVRFERRILESSKMAELGTIGSSIAHELNNPLGGVLSFVQLILMDLKPSDSHWSDIKEMERATLRCRDIIQHLLSFARKQDLGSFEDCEVLDIVNRAIKLIELQSKSKGIQIELSSDAEGVSIPAHSNALTQALCNILQNGVDSITERMKKQVDYPGQIRVHVKLTEDRKIRIEITDNGSGIAPQHHSRIFNPGFTTKDPGKYSGMGLTTAFAIISDHQGTLEILSQTGSVTSAIIALPTSRKSKF